MAKKDEPTMALTLPVHAEPTPLARQERSIVDVALEMVERGLTKESVEALDIIRRGQNEQADRAATLDYRQALCAAQSELKPVRATKAVKNRDGSPRYSYAPLETLMRAIAPVLKKYNFAVSFTSRNQETRMIVTCRLMHGSGHFEENEYPVRIGEGPPGGNACEADEGAITRARRLALCQALNIVVEGLDQDARNEGPPITEDQAEKLRQVVQQDLKFTPQRQAAFVAWAAGRKDATQFSEIPAGRWQECKDWLDKEAKKLGALIEW